MLYIFNLTTTDSKIVSKTLDLEKDLSVKELKFRLIGPIIEKIGYDKIKFFQTGKQIYDDNKIGDFDENERILIFPLIPSLRAILLNNFEKNNINSNKLEESDKSDHESVKSETEKEEINSESNSETKLEIKSNEEILKQNIETLKLFKNENMIVLLNIYKNDRKSFLEFINYISLGQFNEFDEEIKYEYGTGLLTSIRNTFESYKKLSDSELKEKLDKYGGNLDLLLISEF